MTRRRKLAGLALATVAIVIVLNSCATYYKGPESDHFNGDEFFLPWSDEQKSLREVIKWMWTREPDPWPEWVDIPSQAIPAPRVMGDRLVVTYVNHATVLIQTQGLNILTDPHFSERASPLSFVGPKRVKLPGIDFADLPAIDAVLVSHNHYDHMDRDSLVRLRQEHDPRIIVPLGNDVLLGKRVGAEAYDWGDAIALTDTVAIHVEPVQHWSSRKGYDRNHALWAGYVIGTPGGSIYFGGDTGYGPHFIQTQKKWGHQRLALLPIGAYEPRWFMGFQHMNPEEAVQAHLDLEAQCSLGIHWGTFQLTDESIDAPIAALAVALSDSNSDSRRFVSIENGQSLEIPPYGDCGDAPP